MRSALATYCGAALLALPLTMAPVQAADSGIGNDMPVGNAEAGESDFKKCRSCHSITGPEGAIVKGGKVGPNLYGVIGRPAGSIAGTKYSDDMIAAGAAGLIWDTENLVSFVENPAAFLSETLGERARSRMSFRIRGAEDIAAYLATFSPLPEPQSGESEPAVANADTPAQ